jgi:multiple antibiotic resistance protein
VYFIFRGGDTVAKKIGQSGMRAIQRIMGIVLMVIAIQFIINGSETVFSRIF